MLINSTGLVALMRQSFVISWVGSDSFIEGAHYIGGPPHLKYWGGLSPSGPDGSTPLIVYNVFECALVRSQAC